MRLLMEFKGHQQVRAQTLVTALSKEQSREELTHILGQEYILVKLRPISKTH